MITLHVDNILEKPTKYMETIYHLILVTYLHVLKSSGTLHPIYMEYIGLTRRKTVAYLDQTMNNDEAAVIKSFLEILDKLKVSNYGCSVYFPFQTLEKTLKDTVDFEKMCPNSFYIPLLKTVTKQPYTGSASRYVFTQNVEDLSLRNVYHDTIKTTFDNTFELKRLNKNLFYMYFCSFDLSEHTFDNIVKLLLLYNISTIPNYYTHYNFTHLIKIMITTANLIDTEYIYSSDSDNICKMIKELTERKNNLELINSYWLPYLYKYLPLSDNVYSYIKKKSGRTLAEKDAYIKSFLGMYDIHAMEAVESADTPEDDTSKKEPKEEEPKETTEEPTEDTAESTEEPTNEEETAEETDPVVEEKPNDSILTSLARLNIEIADSETEEDILYKETICNLVNGYKANPPDGLSPEELLLLETWCAQWIFLVSTKTTKQLLGQLSITINLD